MTLRADTTREGFLRTALKNQLDRKGEGSDVDRELEERTSGL